MDERGDVPGEVVALAREIDGRLRVPGDAREMAHLIRLAIESVIARAIHVGALRGPAVDDLDGPAGDERAGGVTPNALNNGCGAMPTRDVDIVGDENVNGACAMVAGHGGQHFNGAAWWTQAPLTLGEGASGSPSPFGLREPDEMATLRKALADLEERLSVADLAASDATGQLAARARERDEARDAVVEVSVIAAERARSMLSKSRVTP